MGENHGGRVFTSKDLLVFNYLNKFSFKFGIVECSILAITITLFILKPYNVAALFSGIMICISYLYYDFTDTSEVKEKCPTLPVKAEQEISNTNKVCAKEDLKSTALSDENEDLKRRLKWMERDKYDDLKRINEELVKDMKSESLNLKWWVDEKLCWEKNEVSRLEERCKKLAAERDEMLKRVVCLEERCERLALEKAVVAQGDSVHEKFDALMDMLNEKLEVNFGRKSESDDGYQWEVIYPNKKMDFSKI